MATEPAPPWRLLRLLDGYLVTQLLYVVARLGVHEVLADGPRTGDEIAATVGAPAGALTRVLRGLVVEDVFTEDGAGRFALTPVGAALGGLQGAALVRGELYYGAAGGLLDAVLEGGTAFERVFGERFFEHLGRHGGHQAAFESSMAGRGEQEARDVVAAHDFGGLHALVDVGGGRGVLLAAVLSAVPGLRGVLFDRHEVIATARVYLDESGVGARAECVGGDFFTSVPPGADAYLMSRVLHDWDDADAERLLVACRRGMRPDSQLLVVDAILPERAVDGPAAIRMDLHMLVLLGARERTEREFRTLLERSGFEVRSVEATASPAGLGVVTAVPA